MKRSKLKRLGRPRSWGLIYHDFDGAACQACQGNGQALSATSKQPSAHIRPQRPRASAPSPHHSVSIVTVLGVVSLLVHLISPITSPSRPRKWTSMTITTAWPPQSVERISGAIEGAGVNSNLYDTPVPVVNHISPPRRRPAASNCSAIWPPLTTGSRPGTSLSSHKSSSLTAPQQTLLSPSSSIRRGSPKRLTPFAIPSFRRSSSQSVQIGALRPSSPAPRRVDHTCSPGTLCHGLLWTRLDS